LERKVGLFVGGSEGSKLGLVTKGGVVGEIVVLKATFVVGNAEG